MTKMKFNDGGLSNISSAITELLGMQYTFSQAFTQISIQNRMSGTTKPELEAIFKQASVIIASAAALAPALYKADFSTEELLVLMKLNSLLKTLLICETYASWTYYYSEIVECFEQLYVEPNEEGLLKDIKEIRKVIDDMLSFIESCSKDHEDEAVSLMFFKTRLITIIGEENPEKELAIIDEMVTSIGWAIGFYD